MQLKTWGGVLGGEHFNPSTQAASLVYIMGSSPAGLRSGPSLRSLPFPPFPPVFVSFETGPLVAHAGLELHVAEADLKL